MAQREQEKFETPADIAAPASILNRWGIFFKMRRGAVPPKKEATKMIEKIKVEDVDKIYFGRQEGCYCGCNGTYAKSGPALKRKLAEMAKLEREGHEVEPNRNPGDAPETWDWSILTITCEGKPKTIYLKNAVAVGA